MAKSATLVPTVTLVTVHMTADKETPGTIRFAANEENSVLPTLYVRKEAFAALQQFPTEITVTVGVPAP